MNTRNNRKYQVTLMSAIDELQRNFKALNKLLFNNELPPVIISIQSDVRRMAYAWLTVGKVWSDESGDWFHEINIVAEWLNRPAYDVIGSLVHEMCHLYNVTHGVQDCSRGGTYHNEKFRDVATSHWLECRKVDKYGWAYTRVTDELQHWVEDNTRSGCFRYKRAALYSDGREKKPGKETEDGKPSYTSKGKTSSRKYVCPKCGLTVRATRDLDGKLLCTDCNEILII